MLKRTKCKKFVTSNGFDVHYRTCSICNQRDLSDLEIPQRRLFYNQDLAEGKKTTYSGVERHTEVDSENEANLVSSLTVHGTHAPVIDLDLPARLLPSKTEGHYHLYLDVEMTGEDFFKLLKTMSEVGLVEEGYYEASIRKGASFVRTQEMAIRDTLAK